ncbi:MAG: hypothetical protein LRZ85_10405 [Alphaproteobacteria bacterium]|nr:hypothetical protein [Alphaproteobacteria bacterium]MCD8571395.1 hypothetical protein [Alphaproteobacteria bacterium]
MNTTPAPTAPRDPNAPPSPFSDQLKELLEALECLYIRNNTSGRRGFSQKWPHAAPYVFDEELTAFDAQGVESDDHRARRKELEKEAEKRRDELIEFLETLEAKSVHDGMLQVEFVRDIMMRYRRDMLLYLYAVHIVDKFVPPPPVPQAESEEAQGQV